MEEILKRDAFNNPNALADIQIKMENFRHVIILLLNENPRLANGKE